MAGRHDRGLALTAVVGGGPAISRYTGAVPCSQVQATMACCATVLVRVASSSSQCSGFFSGLARWRWPLDGIDCHGPSLSTAASQASHSAHARPCTPANCRAVPGLPYCPRSFLRSCSHDVPCKHKQPFSDGHHKLRGRPGQLPPPRRIFYTNP